jgi:hypothetical protein
VFSAIIAGPAVLAALVVKPALIGESRAKTDRSRR